MMQRTDIIVNDAVTEDSPLIAELEKKCFSLPWSEAQILNEIQREDALFLKATCNDSFAGYVSGQLIYNEFYISNIAVCEHFRGLGVASGLLNELICRLRKTECVFITLEVRESNIPARRLYEKFDFENLGIRKNFYSRPQENACIYTLFFQK